MKRNSSMPIPLVNEWKLKSKQCLIDRLVVMYILNFVLVLLFSITAVLLITQTRQKNKIEKVYESTIKTNEIEANQGITNTIKK